MAEQIRYVTNVANFISIPGEPIAYWISKQLCSLFQKKKLEAFGKTSKGIITGDNLRFMRLWHEVSTAKINFKAASSSDAVSSPLKWYPCRKGGAARKWYGNNDYIINWQRNGYEIIACAKGENRNCQDYAQEYKFVPSISWTSISTGLPSFRYGQNDLSESAGMSYFVTRQRLPYILAFLNSKLCVAFLQVLSPTLNYTAGAISNLPYENIEDDNVKSLSEVNIILSKNDWDSFETSWNFKKHPLI